MILSQGQMTGQVHAQAEQGTVKVTTTNEDGSVQQVLMPPETAELFAVQVWRASQNAKLQQEREIQEAMKDF